MADRVGMIDVLVAGGGLAGLRAAIEAADSGTHVLLFEKEQALGGSTVLSGGFLAFAERHAAASRYRGQRRDAAG